MLYTDLNHIENAEEYARILNEHENVIVICGRMGPICIPVYRLAVELEEEYGHVKFFDMEYDNPESYFFHALPEVSDLMEIPFTLYYKNGQVVKATSGIQSKAQMKAILDQEFATTVNI
jgi:thioredoxin 1